MVMFTFKNIYFKIHFIFYSGIVFPLFTFWRDDFVHLRKNKREEMQHSEILFVSFFVVHL